MGTKRKPESVLQRRSAETILELIKSLPQTERDRVFELVTVDPQNGTASELLHLLLRAHRFFDWLWRSVAKPLGESGRSLRANLNLEDMEEAKRVFVEIGRVLSCLQPTRQMDPDNQETFDLYLELIEKHGGQKRGAKTLAMRELLTLPSEQRKGYVKQFNKSVENDPRSKGDLESVRQHLKKLEARGKSRIIQFD